jgi:hypothetical protein
MKRCARKFEPLEKAIEPLMHTNRHELPRSYAMCFPHPLSEEDRGENGWRNAVFLPFSKFVCMGVYSWFLYCRI